MKVSLLQPEIRRGDIEHNLKAIQGLVDRSRAYKWVKRFRNGRRFLVLFKSGTYYNEISGKGNLRTTISMFERDPAPEPLSPTT